MDINTLKDLCYQHGITGDTGKFIEYLQKKLKKMGVDSSKDGYGVLIAGNIKNPQIVLSAHADEVGFRVVKRNDDDTFLIKSSGIITPVMLNNSEVYVSTEKGSISGFVYPKKELGNNSPKKFSEIFLDVTEPNTVKVGDFGSYKRTFNLNGDKLIASGLDNRAGVYVLIDFIKQNKGFLKNNAVCFSTEEETTYDCIMGVANKLEPEYMLFMDMFPVHQKNPDINILPEIGKGPAILQSMHKYHLHEEIRNKLKKVKSTYQEVYAEIDFLPEPEAVQHNGKTKGLNIFIPMYGWHTGCYTSNLKDIDKTTKFTKEVVDVLSH